MALPPRKSKKAAVGGSDTSGATTANPPTAFVIVTSAPGRSSDSPAAEAIPAKEKTPEVVDLEAENDQSAGPAQSHEPLQMHLQKDKEPAEDQELVARQNQSSTPHRE